jgi:hypothetical protein
MSTAAKYVILHLACTARRPGTWRFHAAGILREIKKVEPRVRGLAAFFVGFF